MKTSISSIALAVIGISSLAFAIPMSVARAQDQGKPGAPPVEQPKPDTAVAPPAQQFGGGQAQPGFPTQANPFTPSPGQPMPGGPMPQMRGGGMGGPATMVADGDSLYILRGEHLFKVSKSDLRITKVGGIPMDMPMQPNPFDGRPGGGAGAAAGPRRVQGQAPEPKNPGGGGLGGGKPK